jgi:hypothetical protein
MCKLSEMVYEISRGITAVQLDISVSFSYLMRQQWLVGGIHKYFKILLTLRPRSHKKITP